MRDAGAVGENVALELLESVLRGRDVREHEGLDSERSWRRLCVAHPIGGQRKDLVVVHAGELVNVALDALDPPQRVEIEDVSVLDLDHHGQGLGAAVSFPVFVELNVWMGAWKEFVEVRRDADPGTFVPHEGTEEQQHDADRCAVAKDEYADRADSLPLSYFTTCHCSPASFVRRISPLRPTA